MKSKAPKDYYEEIGGLDAVQRLYESTHPEKMKDKIDNCLYLQVAHCNKCGGQSGYNIADGEKVCFDCGEPYEADFHISEVESTITTTNSQDQKETLVESIERKYNIDLGTDKETRLEELLKQQGLPAMSEIIDTPEDWKFFTDGLKPTDYSKQPETQGGWGDLHNPVTGATYEVKKGSGNSSRRKRILEEEGTTYFENISSIEFGKINESEKLKGVENNTEEWEKKFSNLLTHYIDYDLEEKDLIEFIEQLLSERSFSKEELNLIRNELKIDRLLSLEYKLRSKKK